MSKFKKLGGAAKTARIKRLIRLCDEKWAQFARLPRKSSFSGIAIAGEINKIQQELVFHGDHSRTREIEITIEMF